MKNMPYLADCVKRHKLQMPTLVTTPAPTVLPPSRMANLVPTSIMTGAISSMRTPSTLSPIVNKTRKHAIG